VARPKEKPREAIKAKGRRHLRAAADRVQKLNAYEGTLSRKLRGLSKSKEISLPHGLQISRSSRLDCVVWYFCHGQAIESKGAAEH
jgi:hypothetical protein